MLLAGGLVVLLAGGSVMSIPCAELVIPADCKGPKYLPMMVDVFTGSIEYRDIGPVIRLNSRSTAEAAEDRREAR